MRGALDMPVWAEVSLHELLGSALLFPYLLYCLLELTACLHIHVCFLYALWAALL